MRRIRPFVLGARANIELLLGAPLQVAYALLLLQDPVLVDVLFVCVVNGTRVLGLLPLSSRQRLSLLCCWLLLGIELLVSTLMLVFQVGDAFSQVLTAVSVLEGREGVLFCVDHMVRVWRI